MKLKRLTLSRFHSALCTFACCALKTRATDKQSRAGQNVERSEFCPTSLFPSFQRELEKPTFGGKESTSAVVCISQVQLLIIHVVLGCRLSCCAWTREEGRRTLKRGCERRGRGYKLKTRKETNGAAAAWRRSLSRSFELGAPSSPALRTSKLSS
eukprot:2044406-Rhodomonas_salina.3